MNILINVETLECSNALISNCILNTHRTLQTFFLAEKISRPNTMFDFNERVKRNKEACSEALKNYLYLTVGELLVIILSRKQLSAYSICFQSTERDPNTNCFEKIYIIISRIRLFVYYTERAFFFHCAKQLWRKTIFFKFSRDPYAHT